MTALNTTPNTLEISRQLIDQLDHEVVQLLAQRFALSRAIAEQKSTNNLPLRDPLREEVVLARVRNHCPREFASTIETVFRSIINESVRLQELELQALDRTEFSRVCFMGLGLIGGAFARQIRRLHPSTRLSAFDPESLPLALAQGVIDRVADDDEIGDAELIILAASPSQNQKLLSELAPKLRADQVVIDVGSVKKPICDLAQRLDIGHQFIGGHPFFGTEKQGFANSSEVECNQSKFVLTPGENADQELLSKVERWLGGLNLQVKVMTAEEHDRTVASTSHMIQLLTVALGHSLVKDRSNDDLTQLLRISGGALRQTSRLMDSPAALWTDIVAENRQEVLSALSRLRQSLIAVSDAVDAGDADAIASMFAHARRVKSALND